ncbi:hypothetical protein IEQ34_017546 [Dendrobium chrysotoxum]|uniref:Spt5 KOW domain-containing protein n=1 Tax=Dendrobium chrysotoxum TaxID=161865 RepID=A0AAV7GAG5_DENCH|nr:hypothetical protein IEQ34_017546 [Dendrobium chrysotoxum]
MRPGEGPCVADGSCKLALSKIGDGDIIIAHPVDVEAVRPKKSDKVMTMNGALRGITGKLIGIDGADGIMKMNDTNKVKILDMNILAKLAI